MMRLLRVHAQIFFECARRAKAHGDSRSGASRSSRAASRHVRAASPRSCRCRLQPSAHAASSIADHPSRIAAPAPSSASSAACDARRASSPRSSHDARTHRRATHRRRGAQRTSRREDDIAMTHDCVDDDGRCARRSLATRAPRRRRGACGCTTSSVHGASSDHVRRARVSAIDSTTRGAGIRPVAAREPLRLALLRTCQVDSTRHTTTSRFRRFLFSCLHRSRTLCDRKVRCVHCERCEPRDRWTRSDRRVRCVRATRAKRSMVRCDRRAP